MAIGTLVALSYKEVNKGVVPDVTRGVIAYAFAEKDFYVCTFNHNGLLLLSLS
jgi:hypothetical protein